MPEYNRVSYKELQTHISNHQHNKSNFQIAQFLKVKSVTTVQNAFNKEEQKVSDEILTRVMKCIGFDGKVEWIGGIRYYCIR